MWLQCVKSTEKIKEHETNGSSSLMERLEKASVPLSDTIKRYNRRTPASRPDPKTKGRKLSGLQKQDMTLVTQLFLSLQSRPDADIRDFFRFENQRELSSLGDGESLRPGTETNILQRLNAPRAEQLPLNEPRSWCWIWRQRSTWCAQQQRRHQRARAAPHRTVSGGLSEEWCPAHRRCME